ncbi:MAG: hypothetical protein U0Y82_08940 [Thermoleophilia bacterium]
MFFRVGFGLGPGLGGLLAEYGPNPRHLPFFGHLAAMAVGIVAVATAAETLRRDPKTVHPPFRIRIGVPQEQARGFLSFVAPATFLMSFVEGTVLSVVPLFVVEDLHVHNLAVVGSLGFLVLAMGGLAPLFLRGRDPRLCIIGGVIGSSLLSFLVVASSAVSSAAVVVIAAAAIGLINGAILYGGTVICGTIVPLVERGKLMSVLYMCAYSGTVPTVALGYLSDGIGLTKTLLIFSCAALALALFVVTVGRRLFPVVIPYRGPEPA